MTDVVLVALIAAVPATLTAGIAALLGVLNRSKLANVETKVDGTQAAILVELQRLTGESANRGGQLQERDRTQARADYLDDKKASLAARENESPKP